MKNLVVILSVDWEVNHGRWKGTGAEVDYGGVLKGTPAFCNLLDELAIPCTWFIETSSDPKRDLPTCLPDVVRNLTRRTMDEFGLHIHWRRAATDNSTFYETEDVNWVAAQLEHGVHVLGSLGIRPSAFRSGALLRVRNLPRILSTKGFQVDSSTLWGHANRLMPDKRHLLKKSFSASLKTAIQRPFAPLPEPYFADETDVEKTGTSQIVEFPITYSLFDSRMPAQRMLLNCLRFSQLLRGGTRYLMIFFHIDELTRFDSRRDSETGVNLTMTRHFTKHLTALKNSGAEFLTCSAARSRWLMGTKAGD